MPLEVGKWLPLGAGLGGGRGSSGSLQLTLGRGHTCVLGEKSSAGASMSAHPSLVRATSTKLFFKFEIALASKDGSREA